ncbi:uncharacterized protein LOC143293961 [Babylonia areolata]|uniref:uncharacterized protein LOC143293961 n=1 Tax=Babylonia areolata TaxID=304850 RepID=UPI003FD050C7
MCALLMNLFQAAAKDSVGVKQMKLSDCTASYKMKYGLAASLQEPLLKELRSSFFSLNIDEATSNTNKRVLAVLVSHYSESAQKVLIHHLDAFSLTRVCAKDIYSCLESMFDKYELPWENVISVLMDSCSVMRGSKQGLEALIRKKTQMHTSLGHRWRFMSSCTQLCQEILRAIWGISPERYVPHRWLSVFDVALDTLRINPQQMWCVRHWQRKCAENYVQCEQEAVRIHQRWQREKISHFQRMKTVAILNFYVAVLPEIKKYVMFFQRKEPSMHLLHSKQHELFNNFCSLFLRPEWLQGRPSAVDLNKEENFLPVRQMFVGSKTTEVLQTKEGQSFKKEFLLLACKAYTAAGVHLQHKMPIDNKALKLISALDPEVRCTSTAQTYLEYGKRCRMCFQQNKKMPS